MKLIALQASLLTITTAALALVATGCTSDVDGDDDAPESPVPMSEAALANNCHTAFNYFVAKGLTKDQAAGIVGNLQQESSCSPTIYQYGGGPGRGLAQWSAGGRWDTSKNDNVTLYAKNHGLNRWALTTQLDFIWYELTTYGYGYSSLKAATTVSAATVAFMAKYEICGDCVESTRISYADQALADFVGGSTSTKACYSSTKGKDMPANACVQSKSDDLWYQCDDGAWVDRWTDPSACDGVYPL
jgi:Phage tail lysozyme